MNKYKVLLFDLDGTLCDTDEMLIQSFFELYKTYKPTKIRTREELYYFSGPPIKDTLKNEFPDANMDKVTNMCLIHDLGECFTGDIPTFIKTEEDRITEDDLLLEWVKSLPKEVSNEMASLYEEMNEQKTIESKIYKALDKLEAVIQHNESPLSTWEEHEYELNKTYAFDTVRFSTWLTSLREEILKDTINKINNETKVLRK